MKELEEASSNIIHILDVWANVPSNERIRTNIRQYFINQILNLKGDGWRLAIVRSIIHKSDCGLHNEPAYPAELCDCGALSVRERIAVNYRQVIWEAE